MSQTFADSLIANGAHGQCRMEKSGSDLLLSPFNGNRLVVGGKSRVIPDAGVALAPTGATPGTVYYIYAYMNGTVMALEFSTTARAAQAGTGIQIKSGDASRTLVGMARPTTGPAWDFGTATPLTRSWFNRRTINSTASLLGHRTTTSTSLVEVHTEIRTYFLQWSDEKVLAHLTGYAGDDTLNGVTLTQIGWDGIVTVGAPIVITFAAAYTQSISGSDVQGLSEAVLHFATLAGRVTDVLGSTATWFSPTDINVVIPGG